jgi:Na+/melibiose symporter-like transporter
MKISKYAGYGLLGMPLAMSALPVYVQIPAYYTTELGLPLASTGLVLFFARMVDTLQDPLLGRMIDQRKKNITSWLILATCLLALSFYGLWLPPFTAGVHQTGLLVWLGIMLILAYSAHSMINIAYLSWGARLAPDTDATHASTKSTTNAAINATTNVATAPEPKPVQATLLGAAAWREGMGLAGVILASLIPSFIMQGASGEITGRLTIYALGFALLLILSVASLLLFAPRWQHSDKDSNATLREALGNRQFRRLLPIYFLNSLSVSIPATLILFFINDRIQAAQLTGYFLAIYFIAGAAGLPVWIVLARRIGTVKAWKLGMLLAVISFVCSAFLGSGDSTAFVLICIGSGLALGADLALPPVLLAEIIPPDQAPASYYGVWTLLGKLALALSGLALPLLSLLEYQPGQASNSGSLVLLYAALPCILKLFAMHSLHRYPS